MLDFQHLKKVAFKHGYRIASTKYKRYRIGYKDEKRIYHELTEDLTIEQANAYFENVLHI